ncbi:TetR/AcrR family transcriptional regulator [Anianabacter salinae]|uniref:TetR/AcrR family transcriptional regulator n=1 Tax=Anianabacter salinae TaxID=2851023 RepID=UPI00225E0621|nr:TetR/AcrR family transcriptional regulator [Anianabacter salinae]MBV0913746.1 TetR/AcrR family transcriptional regulator [Anianabacter salinae]
MPDPVPKRAPLSRDAVLAAGVAYADIHGAAALSMRKLGAAVGVEAMSLYNHVTNKDDLLDGMLDRVAGELPHAKPGKQWKSSLGSAILTAREVLLAHPWAAEMFLTRPARGPNRLAHVNATVGCLASAGLGPAVIARAMATLDSFLYGAVLQELNAPDAAALSDAAAETDGAEAGHLDMLSAALAKKKRKTTDFEYGLSLILDGIEASAKSSKTEKPSKKKK